MRPGPAAVRRWVTILSAPGCTWLSGRRVICSTSFTYAAHAASSRQDRRIRARSSRVSSCRSGRSHVRRNHPHAVVVDRGQRYPRIVALVIPVGRIGRTLSCSKSVAKHSRRGPIATSWNLMFAGMSRRSRLLATAAWSMSSPQRRAFANIQSSEIQLSPGSRCPRRRRSARRGTTLRAARTRLRPSFHAGVSGQMPPASRPGPSHGSNDRRWRAS